jgi:hypothetical protein
MTTKLNISFILIYSKPKLDETIPIYMRITYSDKSVQYAHRAKSSAHRAKSRWGVVYNGLSSRLRSTSKRPIGATSGGEEESHPALWAPLVRGEYTIAPEGRDIITRVNRRPQQHRSFFRHLLLR